MIYFIQPADGSRVKIGTTIHLARRLGQLCAETGEDLRVLAVIEGGRDEEQALHRRFDHLRIVNEWFEPGNDLLGFIVAEGREWNRGDDPPLPRHGTLIRVSDDFAEAIRRASSFEGISVAEFSTLHLLPVVEKRYKDAVLKEARRVEGQG
jgi:hypothetical protein